MFRLLICLFVLYPVCTAWGQTDPQWLAGQRLPVQWSFVPTYQQFELEGVQLKQVSAPFSLYLPFHRNVGLSARISGVGVEGDGLESLAGVGDTQLDLSINIPAGSASIVLNLGANLPSGKREVTPEEFVTLSVISQSLFNFRTPSLGQGLGFSPGLTMAFPVNEKLVLGLGVAYQRREAFRPLEDMVVDYDPGDELLFTAGFDTRLSPQLILSGDLTYTTYEADLLGETEFFASGDKVVATVQLQHRTSANTLSLVGRIRSRAKNSVAAAGGELVEEAVKSSPNQTELFLQNRVRLGSGFYFRLLGELRRFEEQLFLPDVRQLYGAGLGLDLPLSNTVELPLRFVYQLGDLEGFEVRAGLQTSF